MNWRHEKWLRLYVREEGSFARLPLMARAIAAEVLKLCDENGRIEVGDKTLAEVVAFRQGATQGDRRMLRLMLPHLFADGYLVQDGAFVTVRNYRPAQRRANDEPATSCERPSNEPVTTQQRASNENQPKCPELFESRPVEKIREEKKREERKPPADKPRSPSLFVEVLDAFKAAWKVRNGSDYEETAQDRSQLGRLLAKFPKERLPELRKAFAAYLSDPEDFLGKQGWRLAYFCSSGYLNKFAAKQHQVKQREWKEPEEWKAPRLARNQPTGNPLVDGLANQKGA